MKLTLEITLGNEEMRTRGDVLVALQRSLGPSMDRMFHPFANGDSGKLMDENGNTEDANATADREGD